MSEVLATDVAFKPVKLKVAMEAGNVLVRVVWQVVPEKGGGEVAVKVEEATITGSPGTERVGMAGWEGGVGPSGAVGGLEALGGKANGSGDGDNKGRCSGDLRVS